MEFAIETNGLSKFYGNVCAINKVDLRVKRGEIYGFLGLNGAGKTTTIRALLGMIRPSAGKVRVLDQALGAGGRGPWAQVGHLVKVRQHIPSYPSVRIWMWRGVCMGFKTRKLWMKSWTGFPSRTMPTEKQVPFRVEISNAWGWHAPSYMTRSC